VTFGFSHGFLTGERQLAYGIYPASLSEMVVVAFMGGAAFAIPLAVISAMLRPAFLRLIVLGVIWMYFCKLAFYMTAHGYRSAFGATWLAHEPFWELMWSPWLTPLAVLLGLVPFLWAVRNR
jgi:hypothetical protein